jgi:ATP-binding cassette, subfamily B (MDR/TAP), member 1
VSPEYSVNSKDPVYLERMTQLTCLIDQKVEEYRKSKEEEKLQVPYSKILLTYADRKDKCLMICGYASSIISGLGLPSFVFLFGDIVDSFGPGSSDIIGSISLICLVMTVIGVGIWITGYIYVTSLAIMAERVGKKTRVAYLRSVLNQEIAWFDENNATEIPAKIVREVSMITKALGEKMANLLMSLAMSVSGIAFAFTRGWWMALILLFAFPTILIASLLMGESIKKGTSENLKAYAQSAGYAEQALNAIRVVQAFG